MLRPFLVVGVGGSGGKTLRAARQALQSKLDLQGWEGGWPEAWQFLHIDSPTTPDGLEFPAPLLPQEDYLSLVRNGVGYKAIHDKVLGGLSAKLALDVQRCLPRPEEVNPPVNLAPAPYRAIGRTVAMGAMKEIHDKVRDSLGKMQSSSADAELKEITRLFGAEVSVSQPPTVIVISSLFGVSGSGMFIDVAEAIKAAAGPGEWAHSIFSLLFAPDVFDELGPANLTFQVPNATGALAELVSGFWRTTPTEGTLTLYRKHGLNVPQDRKSTIGPAFNYVIGRRNGNANPTDLGSQTGVYLATANSLAAWMTNAIIQDGMSGYVGPSGVPMLQDRTQLATVSAGQPLSSLGFGRVSLGIDRFSQYAAERLAKQTLKTLLSQHTSTDPELKEMNEEQWIEHFTNLNEGAFISESGFDELTEKNNQVVEALVPDTAELQERFKRALSTAVAGKMPAGGYSQEEWTSLMVNAYQAILPDHLEGLSKLVQEKAREWVQKMPEKILTLVTQTASRQGLPVTAKLLERLIQRTAAGAKELTKQQAVHVGDSGAIRDTVAQAMEPAASMELVPRDHPTITQALTEMELAMDLASMADIKNNAGELMVDFLENFLEPLRLTLSSGYFALKDATAGPKLLDGTQNPYAGWPDFTQKGVGRHLFSAPNESMLIDVEDFPSEFDTLVHQAVNDSTKGDSQIVIEELVMGSKSGEVSKLQDNQQWDILTVKQAWIPKNPNHQIREAVNQPAVFALAVDLMEYLGFAKKWIKIPGRAFRAFLDQTISNYLHADGDQAAQSARSQRFVAALWSAIESADPLVELDQKLLLATHGQIGRMAFSSGIPVDKADPLREDIDNILVTNGYDPDRGWYISGSKAATAKSIDIFTQLTSSISPIPMASLMRPILQEWRKASSHYSSRSNFMTWRRGRRLAEAIPAHPVQWQTMLNGWFIGRMLDLVGLDKSDPSFREKGPRLGIWANPAEGWVDFPYPLHSKEIATNVDDFPAIVLDSLVVAMANCHATESLAPLSAYHRLLALGGADGDFEDLENWIRFGKVPPNAPIPRVGRAGTPQMDWQERQDTCATYLENLLAKFSEKMAGLDSHADSRTYPIAWELWSEIEHALEAGIKAVRSIEPTVQL
jgi:hypothetical protein